MKPLHGTVHHVVAADRGQTLAAFLRGRIDAASWSQVQKLVRGRRVLIHGNVCTDAGRRLQTGEVVKVLEDAAPRPPAAGDVRIVHLDQAVVVVDKPPGVTSTRHHEERGWPARRRQLQPTLEELVPEAIARELAGRGQRGGSQRRRRPQPVRAVHRIDRETSGLLVFARTVPAGRILAEQFRLHTTQRRYLALVVGRLAAGTIRTHLVRDRGDGRRGSSEDGSGKLAVTHVDPVEHFGDAYTLVECRLETGRTHQIRIHLAELGHPICGERVYAAAGRRTRRDESRAPRVMLHAAELGFVHPESGDQLAFESPLPADMQRVMSELRKRFAGDR
ncbi:MAG: RluA family pseudouridine synthase [Planctomycetota bacterium]|nr:RluA family pseudouridine synthase [Planctomycetota bacterium]MDA1201529.1 RluA family pseudouridine synthase [Planctomycetota bacterium]